MIAHPAIAIAKTVLPPVCSTIDCFELAAAIVAERIALCGKHALEWYRKERVR